jgi:hypothetical protein
MPDDFARALGLPRVSDGSLLFLQQMIARMKPAEDQGRCKVVRGAPELGV